MDLSGVLQNIYDGVRALWAFEIMSIEGNALTIANIILSLLVFWFGLRFSKKISRLFVDKVKTISQLNANAQAILESISFYCFLILFVLLALNFAQIPVGTFAFLGGAFAIGFGFGSQNIIKNFISGLILMVEQPVRVGDIITAESNNGRVIRIGARSTHICTFDNVDIMIPNSTLLENNVVNWTLSDDNVRTRVSVGVAYGSETKQVEVLLLEAVKDIEEVLKDFPIDVFFTEFGDNSLNFEVQFWCVMKRPSDKRMLESKVRHKISDLFNRHQIVIAFPQRDVHLDVVAPIPVQVQK
jgi:small-conductance mechanosensitive channel